VNRDNIQRVINLIESLDPCQFDMHTWGEECGTPACIGGWTDRLFHAKNIGVTAVCRTLDITDEKGFRLFYPTDIEAYNAKPQQAIRALEILRDTGEVDWPRAMREGAPPTDPVDSFIHELADVE
jgi:hypothetical protein